MTVAQAVQKWFAERPEYQDQKPTSVAPLILQSLTIETAMTSLRTTVIRSIGDLARSEGKNAISDEEGSTIYVDPIDLPLENFITDYLVPQKQRAQADIKRIKERCAEYVKAHPAIGMTATELYQRAA